MALLTGVRVVDFSAAAAGPFCTQLLGDLGAEVIKIEPPTGEHGRHWGDTRIGDKSFLYLAGNRNKKSVVVDLKSAQGRADVERLVESADVVVSSYAPPRAAQFHIDYASLKKVRADLIYVSITGYGATGPRMNANGMDVLLQADTGIMSFTGEPGRPSVRMAISALDIMTGAMGFAGAMAALRERDTSGEGQLVDVSLYDSAMSMLLWAVPQVSATGVNPRKMGSDFEHLFPYSVWELADGYAFIGSPNDGSWRFLAEQLGRADLIDDPRFATNPARVANREDLREILAPLLGAEPLEHWLETLPAGGVLVSQIREVDDAIADPHALARGAVRDLPGFPGIKVPGPPLHLERGMLPESEWTAPPSLGADNDKYLSL
ncbi:formyl-CoA transferase [Microbacterium sp. CH12i]|uniref:CaiB/BaiF CoA transferase family protein n=1 Tax=Microbacterium sp. CH12i TaxID=1479651 RepID=UPI000460CA35|nr:CoA transferase [Microbacterium sp. CH12i]KDA04864.1 formyl-CoA transferase [Microbacterium sp. CH12i]